MSKALLTLIAFCFLLGGIAGKANAMDACSASPGLQMGCKVKYILDCRGGCAQTTGKRLGVALPRGAIVRDAHVTVSKAFVGIAHIKLMFNITDNATLVYAGNITDSAWTAGEHVTYIHGLYSDNSTVSLTLSRSLYAVITISAITDGVAEIFLTYDMLR
jgi:hypothetical protein